MKQRKLRKDRVAIALLLTFFIISAIDIVISEPVTYTTPVGEYQCKGHIIQACGGSEAVGNHLGI